MSFGCVSYRSGDQQSAGFWLLRLVATMLGNPDTIVNAWQQYEVWGVMVGTGEDEN